VRGTVFSFRVVPQRQAFGFHKCHDRLAGVGVDQGLHKFDFLLPVFFADPVLHCYKWDLAQIF
jgi:hypothetical protein